MFLRRSGSAEPIGGVSRFQSLVNYYRSHPQFAGQPDILTFFSGDAFNPSIESTITKGRHMVPFLNTVGTDVACVGVSMATIYPPGMYTANLFRIMTLILEFPSSAIWRVSVIFLGSWQISLIQHWEMISQ